MRQYADEDRRRHCEEQYAIEDGEDDGPAGAEEHEADAIAFADVAVVMVQVEAGHKPRGDGELEVYETGIQGK